MTIILSDEWEELCDYCGLKEDDLQRLHHHASFFEKYGKEIVDEFYAEIEKQPQLYRILHEHSSLERLKKLQFDYFTSLSGEVIDNRYLKEREQIGAVHARIGLTPPWFISAYSVYIQLVYKRIRQTPENIDLFTSLIKRLFFDMMVILKQYDQSVEQEQYRSVMEQLSGEISESLNHLNDISKQYAQSAQSLASAQEQIAQSMRELQESSREIERLSKFVLEISDKTHLLGLNAAIEAARAGEQGRGFSIVADEVRKLAADAKKSSAEIKEAIAKIVTQVNRVDQQVEQTMAISQQQAAYAEELAVHIRHVEAASQRLHERSKDR